VTRTPFASINVSGLEELEGSAPASDGESRQIPIAIPNLEAANRALPVLFSDWEPAGSFNALRSPAIRRRHSTERAFRADPAFILIAAAQKVSLTVTPSPGTLSE
jgi:hypothetical protein